MSSRNDDDNLELTNEEVDDALNFGMNFDDMHHELQDNSLPALGMGNASLGTCSPSPSFDDSGSLTSTGSKRSRATFDRGSSTENEQSPKRRMSAAMSWSAGGGVADAGADTALAALRMDREREGRCAECGIETHSIVSSNKGYEKTPLNVEGEVFDGRCLFCHPLLEEGESPKKGKKTNASMASALNMPFRFDNDTITPQQTNRQTPLKSAPTPYPTPSQSGMSASSSQNSEGKQERKHSWTDHVRMNLGIDDNGNSIHSTASLTKAFTRSVNNERPEPDDASRGSQYSSRSQVSEGRLGKAMATGMGMSCAEQPNTKYKPISLDSKSPHASRRSPKMRDPPSSTTTPVSNSSQSQHFSSQNISPLGGSERGGNGDVPAHVRLAHNKLPSSIYHHHLFPMNQETEQAYIEKTLAYLESGGGDIVDLIVAMRRFPFSLAIQSMCCEKLYVHCFEHDHAHAIVLVGGIRTVIDAMEYHTTDIALQRGCAGIIKHMAAASKFNLEMLDKLGAVKCVVNAMEQNMTSAPLLESCCWALGTMAREPNSKIKLRIAKAGGVHMAMHAVERFPQNESLLRAAFHCLQQLGYNPSTYAAGTTQQNQLPQQQVQSSQQIMQRQQLQQLENEMRQSVGGGNQQNNMNQAQQQHLQRMVQSIDPMQQMNMNQAQQQQLQRMMQNIDMQQMNMNQTQQQQFQRMMSPSNEIQQMQLSQSQLEQQQLQLLNRQRQQMLAMSQVGVTGAHSNEEVMGNMNMMRMNMMNSMGMGDSGNSQSLLNKSNSPTGNNDGGNSSGRNSRNARRRM
jgi:hypothetical protein